MKIFFMRDLPRFEKWIQETDTYFYNRKELPDRHTWIKKFQQIRRRWTAQFVCN